MLTEAASTVDAAVRVSVTELARIKGVSKQAISKRLKRYEEEGRIASQRHGGEVTISLAEWDTVAGEVTDPAKLAGADSTKILRGEGDEARQTRDPTYTKEVARRAGYEADLKEIELRKKKGELVEVAAVVEAMTRCAEAIVRDLDRLPAHAEDLADVVARGGAPGLREQLKKIVRELRETLARSMSVLGEAEQQEEA